MMTFRKTTSSIFALIIITLMVIGSIPVAFADGVVPVDVTTPVMTVEVSMEPVITVEGATEASDGTMDVVYKEGDLVIEFGYSLEETTEVSTEATTTEPTSEAADPLYKWDGTGTRGTSNNTYLFNIENQTDKTKADENAYCVDITIGANKNIAYTKIALSDYEKMTDAQKVKVTAILNHAEKNPVTKQSIADTQLALWYVVNEKEAPKVAKAKYEALNLGLTEADLAKYEAKVEYSDLEHTYSVEANSPTGVFGNDGFIETESTTAGATTVKIVADEENVPEDGFTLKVTVKGTKSTKEYYVYVPISVNNKGVYNTQPLISAVMGTFTETLTAQQEINFTKEIKEIIKEVVKEEKPVVPVTIPEGDDEERTTPNTNPVVTEIVIEEVPLAAPTVEAVTTLAPETVQEAMIPLGVVALPKTGELPTTLFYGIGGLISGLGVLLRKKI